MASSNERLVGRWRKVTDTPCSAVYPAAIDFQARGLYFGTAAQPGDFARWDVGTYEVLSDDQVKISTANDEVVAYRYSLAGDVLSFADRDGCSFQYRKE